MCRQPKKWKEKKTQRNKHNFYYFLSQRDPRDQRGGGDWLFMALLPSYIYPNQNLVTTSILNSFL